MALPHGPRADRNPDALPAKAGRALGFAALATAGLCLVAGVVLVPAYARVQLARHALAVEKAKQADEQDRLIAQEHLLADKDDPVLLRRMVWTQMGLAPVGVQVEDDAPAQPDPPAGEVISARHPRPAPPDTLTVRLAHRLDERPGLRRGLFLLGVGSLLLAAVMFGPPRRRPADARAEKA